MASVRCNLVRVFGVAGSLGLAIASAGCQSGGATAPGQVLGLARQQQYGRAALQQQNALREDGGAMDEPNAALSRLRLVQLGVLEGQPAMVDEAANQLFNLLRTQGANDDRALATVLLGEGVRAWKGEPFEQAMAYALIAQQKAMLGEWDNARAASGASLFLLRDYSEAMGKDGSAEDLAREAAKRDARSSGEGERLLDNGYVQGQTDFALGYLLAAAANKALSRPEEASDNLLAAARARPTLDGLTRRMLERTWNTLVLVEYGEGPRKMPVENDPAQARYTIRTRSDDRALVYELKDASGRVIDRGSLPHAQDVNQMAASHRWNGLQTVRSIKSALGDAMIVGGAVAATNAKDDEARMAGAIAIGLGLLLKAGSAADVRHAELLPQRVYALPLEIQGEGQTLTVFVEGDGVSRTVVWGLREPASRGVATPMQLRVVRLPTGNSMAWHLAGTPTVGNDRSPEAVPGDTLPWILGGSDVRVPTPEVMERYHAAGNLREMTLVDLENLYREDGIALRVEDTRGRFEAHMLEGGNSLVPPIEGSIGALRLFSQRPGAYKARSEAVREAQERYKASREQANETGARGTGERETRRRHKVITD